MPGDPSSPPRAEFGGAGSGSLTCLSLSAAIRGCLSWSCFLRSPFCGNTEERAQAGHPGGSSAPGAPRAAAPPPPTARGPGCPQRAPSSPGRVLHARRPGSAARGRLPVAAASSGQLAGRGGGRGHPAARPEPCKFAGRGACASECECDCVPGEGGGTKSQVNTASPCRAKLINIQVAS